MHRREGRFDGEQSRYGGIGTRPRPNDRVMEHLVETADGYDIALTPEDGCALCTVDAAFKAPVESVFYATPDYQVVETADRKGHDIRNMAVWRACGEIPEDAAWTDAVYDLVRITAGQVYHADAVADELVVYGSMHSQPRHCHVVASDTGGDLAAVPDYLQFDAAAVVEADRYEPETCIRTRLGAALLPQGVFPGGS